MKELLMGCGSRTEKDIYIVKVILQDVTDKFYFVLEKTL